MLKLDDHERVEYATNPLEEVVCQIVFPRILEIESTHPVALQKKIRSKYPLINVRKSEPDIESIYDFETVDHRFKLSLGSNFIALATSDYKNWNEFRENLSFAFKALDEEYSLTIIERIGLRYIDVIDREKLGLEDVPWGDLLQPHIAGILSYKIESDQYLFFSEGPITKNETFTVPLENSTVTLRHGLVINSSKKVGYLIDSDFFNEKPKAKNAGDCLDELDAYNKEARNMFRWCISETLHQALQSDKKV